MSRAIEFFEEIDRRWDLGAKRTKLHIIGCSALMLQVAYDRGTKDSDVLELDGLDATTKDRLLELAGPTSPLRNVHRMYIEVVGNGFPFLPQNPVWRSVSELDSVRHFEVVALDVVDVVVSKLSRLHADDVADIDAMVARDLVPHDRMLERFRAAVDSFSYDARADDLPSYVANLHRVERDIFAVEETEIELPSWVSG